MIRPVLACLSLGLLVGCSNSEPAASKGTASNAATADYVPPSDAPAAAELSAEDKAAAEKQGICPVTDEKLFGHGTPVKVTVKDRTVFLCCKPCEEALLKDPDKYLAKLDQKPADAGTAPAAPAEPSK